MSSIGCMDRNRLSRALDQFKREHRQHKPRVRTKLRARREVEQSAAFANGRIAPCRFGLCINPAEVGGLCQAHYAQGLRLIQKFAVKVSSGER